MDKSSWLAPIDPVTSTHLPTHISVALQPLLGTSWEILFPKMQPGQACLSKHKQPICVLVLYTALEQYVGIVQAMFNTSCCTSNEASGQLSCKILFKLLQALLGLGPQLLQWRLLVVLHVLRLGIRSCCVLLLFACLLCNSRHHAASE